jgi:A/G-specific adenine glycosylase
MQRYNDFDIKKNKSLIFAKKNVMNDFSTSLIVWYKQHKRDLPWRNTKDPYFVWISEIILQQTRVNQGLNYYHSFTKSFPTIHHLANAEEDEVLMLWQGLGYYSRARNMHFTAKIISKELNGQFPQSYKGLLKLKGVGPYTAAAISSICFNEHQTVVDGNVFRLLSRLFGISTPINSSKGKKEFDELAHSLNDNSANGLFNQALMEFGALHCTPKKPQCSSCIFSLSCYAHKEGVVDKLPVKEKKLKIKKRFLSFLFVKDRLGYALIQKRMENDIWKGLYHFPMVETSKELSVESLLSQDAFDMILQNQSVELIQHHEITHILTHQKLHISIVEVKINQLKSSSQSGYLKINVHELKDFAFPKPLHGFITNFALK